MALLTSLSRRKIMQGGAATVALASLAPRAHAADDYIVVTDPGGPYTIAYRQAFYDPFQKATGIKVISAAREAQPMAQVAEMVRTKNYLWDVTTLTQAQDVPLLEEHDLLEPLGLKPADFPNILPEAVRPDWLGVDTYATILAYRSDKFQHGPESWADFWNIAKFPGRRSLRRSPIDTLEQALMADGVPPDALYPLDVDRAFRSLDRIRPHIDIWWTSGAQAMQMIQNGDVAMLSTWNGRAQAAIDNKAPVKISWNQGLYSIEGWGVLKGTPRAAAAKKFVLFCANAKRQAAFTDVLAYGPTNRRAFDYISPTIAKTLPTAPENLKLMRNSSVEWWTKNRDAITERFNNWVIG